MSSWTILRLITTELCIINFILEGTTHANLMRLQVQQNCALRAVKCVDSFYSGDLLRDEQCIDSINVMVRKAACKFAYRDFYDLGPTTLNEMFELLISERDLRSNEQLLAMVPRCRTKFGEWNFRFRAVLNWNCLPVNIKMSTSPDNFKLVLKTYHWPD